MLVVVAVMVVMVVSVSVSVSVTVSAVFCKRRAHCAMQLPAGVPVAIHGGQRAVLVACGSRVVLLFYRRQLAVPQGRRFGDVQRPRPSMAV